MHVPLCLTLTPALAAMQEFVYVVLLQPQTGAWIAGQAVGRATQVPGVAHAAWSRQYEPVPAHWAFVVHAVSASSDEAVSTAAVSAASSTSAALQAAVLASTAARRTV